MNSSDYAKHIGVSRQRVSVLVKQGRVVLAPDGSVDVPLSDAMLASTMDDSRPGQLRENHAGAEGTASSDEEAKAAVVTLAQARRREVVARAEKAEIEVGQAAGELVRRADVEQEALAQGRRLQQALSLLPDRICYELSQLDDPELIRVRLDLACREVLNEFCKGNG